MNNELKEQFPNQEEDFRIITKRPEGMSFETYKDYQKLQKIVIKEYLKGSLYYKAAEIFYAPEDKNKLFGIKTKFPPFKGNTKDLLEPIKNN